MATEILAQIRRTMDSDAYIAGLLEENAQLRQRAQRAEVERDVLAETNAELATDFIRAQQWSRTWKKAAKNERETRRDLEVLIAEHEARDRKVFGVPFAGTVEADAKFGNHIAWNLSGKRD